MKYLNKNKEYYKNKLIILYLNWNNLKNKNKNKFTNKQMKYKLKMYENNLIKILIEMKFNSLEKIYPFSNIESH